MISMMARAAVLTAAVPPVPACASGHGKFRSFKFSLFPGLYYRFDIAGQEGMDTYALFQNQTFGLPGNGSADQLLHGMEL